jgi:hypothetical protein
LVKTAHGVPETINTSFGGHATVKAAFRAYAEALGKNVWLNEFPVSLEQVYLINLGDNWILRDHEDSFVEVSPAFPDNWKVLAHSGGHPINIFGEWDGQYFYPLVFWAEHFL